MWEKTRRGAALAAGLLLFACGSKDESGAKTDASGAASPAKPDVTATAAVTATATATASASAAVDHGPVATIPAGTFKAGSRCHDVPRMRPYELENQQITLGEYQMDKYPYPNKAGEPAMLNVSRTKAAELCEERGKRLCTEMEWERACKGTKSTTFPWGNGFKKGVCDGQKDHLTGKREKCTSDFGVNDLIGIGIEWTGSDWDRGTTTGEAVVRGARAEKVSWLSARCTHTRKRDPNKEYDNVGFRCCSGPENSASVSLRYRKQRPVLEDPATDDDLERALMKAMPRDHRGIVGVELSFDKVYRWHPVYEEELIIARWKGTPKEGKPFYEIAVFKMCGRKAWLSARFHGPVESVSPPKIGVSKRKISFDIERERTRGSANMRYWHGHVKMTMPVWVPKGNQLSSGSDAKPADSASSDAKPAASAASRVKASATAVRAPTPAPVQ